MRSTSPKFKQGKKKTDQQIRCSLQVWYAIIISIRSFISWDTRHLKVKLHLISLLISWYCEKKIVMSTITRAINFNETSEWTSWCSSWVRLLPRGTASAVMRACPVARLARRASAALERGIVRRRETATLSTTFRHCDWSDLSHATSH